MVKRGIQGRMLLQRVPVEPYRAYVPDPLPPNPPILMDSALTEVLEQANRAIGRSAGPRHRRIFMPGLLLNDLLR